MTNRMSIRTQRKHLVLLLLLGSMASPALGSCTYENAGAPCSALNSDCGCGLECDLPSQTCVHIERQFLEPCSLDNPCAEVQLGTATSLECGPVCQRCVFAEELEGQQALDGVTTSTTVSNDCGFSSELSFFTWSASVITGTPVIFPETDAELETILSTAKANGCKVRPTGKFTTINAFAPEKCLIKPFARREYPQFTWLGHGCY